MLAAAPAWFADNLPQISVGTLLVLVVLVVRLVQEAFLRALLLLLILGVGVLVFINREPLRTCARTCECDLGGRQMTVPICSSDLKL